MDDYAREEMAMPSAPKKVEGQFSVGDEVWYLSFHEDTIKQGVVSGVRWDEYQKTITYEIYNGEYCSARHAFTAESEESLKDKLIDAFNE